MVPPFRAVEIKSSALVPEGLGIGELYLETQIDGPEYLRIRIAE